ncbi:MAG: caspase family protein [Myxococcales bacterium]|nr:caspase family protein [Myxococcales bacterium]
MRRLSLAACLFGVIPWIAPAPADAALTAPEARGVRRFALIVGANDGGPERARLRYAGSDASSLSAVLRRHGGVAPADRVMLLDPTPARLQAALRELAARVSAARAAGERVQFLFYYSGHSDEHGLLLGGVVIPYRELRAQIDQVPADVRLGVLDSCASGAFTRVKGGKMQAPFLFGGAGVEGHAYLTSSSDDEAAQESDRIRGSFFTHFLLTGLRGAADVNGDRLVTLNEAYRFAFDETLARTELTAGGPQHAAYDIKLTGTGDVVMTDLRETTSKLEIAAEVGGRIYVRTEGGELVAELYKPPAAGAVVLAVEPGTYKITVDDGRTRYQTTRKVADGMPASVRRTDLRSVDPERTRARGDDDDRASGGSGTRRSIPFDIGVVPEASVNAIERDGKPITNNFQLALVYGRNARTYGFSLGIGAAIADEEVRGVQLGVGASVTKALHGAQLSAGVDVATAEAYGAQVAAIGPVSQGATFGMQIGGVFTYTGGDLRGFQASGVNNVTRGVVYGAQITGGLNVAGEVRGAQVAPLNVTRGRVHGVQIGVINYADEADASVALIPITRKGGVAGEFWTSDTAILNLGMRLRARSTYAMYSVGVHPFGAGRGWQAGLGFGGRIRLAERLSLDIDLASYAVFPNFEFTRTQLLNKLRLTLAGRIGERFELWGGPTANVLHDWHVVEGDARIGYPWVVTDYTTVEKDYRVRFWPGFVLGIRY